MQIGLYLVIITRQWPILLFIKKQFCIIAFSNNTLLVIVQSFLDYPYMPDDTDCVWKKCHSDNLESGLIRLWGLISMAGRSHVVTCLLK